MAAAATMGGLNIILLAALVFLFLRHKNILPAIKSGMSLRFQYYLGDNLQRNGLFGEYHSDYNRVFYTKFTR